MVTYLKWFLEDVRMILGRAYRWLKVHPWSIVLVITFATMAFTYLRTEDLVQDDRRESAIRADQFCLGEERAHRREVRQLRETYKYLLRLTPSQLKDPLNEYVLLNISRTEEQARTDEAPSYCDDPGFGLPEPDPKVPKRPDKIYILLGEKPPKKPGPKKSPKARLIASINAIENS